MIDPYNFPKFVNIEGVDFFVVESRMSVEQPSYQMVNDSGATMLRPKLGGNLVLELKLECSLDALKSTNQSQKKQQSEFIKSVKRKFNFE